MVLLLGLNLLKLLFARPEDFLAGLMLLEPCFGGHALGMQLDHEHRALVHCTLHTYRPSLLLDQTLADRQAKSCAFSVHRFILVQLSEIDE